MEPSEVGNKRFGNELIALKLQPDYRISSNGYGLMQLTANFAGDGSQAVSNLNTTFARGASLPDTLASSGGFALELATESWGCVTAEEAGREGDVTIITAHYACISKVVNGGTSTFTEATVNAATVSEPITAHPNFTKKQIKNLSGKTPLGGVPPYPVNVPDPVKNPNNAKWIPSQTGQTQSYQFVDFLPSQGADEPVNKKAGIKSYMRPSVTMRLTGYTMDSAQAQEAIAYVGFQCEYGVGFLAIPEPYRVLTDSKGYEFDGISGARNWLITGANLEIYGNLYKVTVDLMLSGILGWDNDIYPIIGSDAAGSFTDGGSTISVPNGGWFPGNLA